MKVEKIDIIWAVLSFITVGVTYHFGYLLFGVAGIYLLMAALFTYHIFTIKKRQKGTKAVYGKITGYRTVKDPKEHHYPEVDFETEEGELISSAYSVADKEKRYDVGSEELICYDPDDPMFFYFANRENEMTQMYYRCIVGGGFVAAAALITAFVLR